MNDVRDVFIPDTVETILDFACYINKQISSLFLGSNVKKIGSFAFYSCSMFYGALFIPDSVTSIGSYAFYECQGVTSVTIGNGLTTIENYTFSAMSSLTSVNIGENVESVGTLAFAGSTKLSFTEYENAFYLGPSSNPYRILYKAMNTAVSTLKIHDDTERITEESFMGNSSLKTVVIPNNVKVIEKSAFRRTGLESLTLGSSVDIIDDWAFSYCPIKELIIPDSVTFIGNSAFYGDSSKSALTKIEIGKKVSHIGDFAFACNNLVKEVEIPDSVTYIGRDAFYHLSSVKTIKIGKGVKDLGHEAFFGNLQLESLKVDSDNPYFTTIDNVLYDKERKTLIFCVPTKKSVKIEETVTTLYDEAFYSCVNMTEITLPKSVNSLKANVFGYCTSLRAIYVAEGNSAFQEKNGCLLSKDGKELLVVPKGRKFVNVPSSVTHIPSSLFFYSEATSVFVGDKVAVIDSQAFYYAQKMEEISIGSGVTSIGASAFSSCTSLKKFCYFGKKDLSLTNIFDGSTRDLNITVPLDYEDGFFCRKRVTKASECTVSAESSDPEDPTQGSGAANLGMAAVAFIASAMLYLLF